MTIPVSVIAQVLAGSGLALYGLYLLWKQLPAIKLPSFRSADRSGPATPTVEDDRHTVLAIAGRLGGNAKAISLCEQLLHEMLHSPGKVVIRPDSGRQPL